MNLNGLNQKDDLYVYTTKHYFYGLMIQRAWNRKKLRKRAREEIKSQRSTVLQRIPSNKLVGSPMYMKQSEDGGPTNASALIYDAERGGTI